MKKLHWTEKMQNKKQNVTDDFDWQMWSDEETVIIPHVNTWN